MENALDAGATEINLVIRDAGKSLLQVIDNGCGMSPLDARMSFERHATSKISNANDLFAIRTLGFRGEALASIAAIAHVEIKTRQHEDELGTCLRIEGSEVKSQEPCPCSPGTNMLVKNLFFNVPARRNFLKSNTAETRHIIEEFTRVALFQPRLSFSMVHNDKPVFKLPAGSLKSRIVGLLGTHYDERLLPVDQSTQQLKVSGFIGKPEFARKTSGEPSLFVTQRFIKHAHHRLCWRPDHRGGLPHPTGRKPETAIRKFRPRIQPIQPFRTGKSAPFLCRPVMGRSVCTAGKAASGTDRK